MNNITADAPRNIEAETGLIESVMRRPATFERVANVLPADFWFEPYRWLWTVMSDTYAAGIPVTAPAIRDGLRRMGKFEEFQVAGTSYTGAAAFAALASSETRAADADGYAVIVRDWARKREQLNYALKLAAMSANGKTSAEIATEYEAAAAHFSGGAGGESGRIYTAADGLRIMDAGITDIRTGQNPPIKTGLLDLDALIRGLHKGDFAVIAGRPGTGKSSLLNTIACNVIPEHGRRYRTLIFSLEMKVGEVWRRFVANKASIASDRLRDGELKDDEWERYNHTIETYESAPLYTVDISGLTVSSMRAKMREAANKFQPELVMLDYIGLMTGDIKQGRENRVQEVSYITRNLKQLAQEFDVPLVAACQMNRAIEARAADSEPQMSDLRESGSIENDADLVLFLYPDKVNPNEVNAKLAKQRNGKTGIIKVGSMLQYNRFTSLQKIQIGA